MDKGGAAYIERIRTFSEGDEQALLDAILTSGFDQGCFLRPDQDHMLALTAEDAERILEALQDRSIRPTPSVENPFSDSRPTVKSIPGADPGHMVLTQQCDLLRSLSDEPFVELARVTLVSTNEIIAQAKRNSPRLLHLADGPGATAWVADLRVRSVMAKDCLTHYDVLPATSDARSFKRLKLRIGHRHSRDALPTEIVRNFQGPLVTFLRKSKASAALVKPFTEFLVWPEEDEKLYILAIADKDADQKTAEDAWQELEDNLPQELVDLIDEGSGAMNITDVSFWRYLSGWRLDLDEITYGSRGGPDQAPPVS